MAAGWEEHPREPLYTSRTNLNRPLGARRRMFTALTPSGRQKLYQANRELSRAAARLNHACG